MHFYPRSPCGERPYIIRHAVNLHPISIHALLAESDSATIITICIVAKFLSTLSLRRATSAFDVLAVSALLISIHALLAESDHQSRAVSRQKARFLSTLSLRRATVRRASRQQPAGISIHALLAESDAITYFYPQPKGISIHALLAESDGNALKIGPKAREFLSTLSLRRATGKSTTLTRIAYISIHALLAESDANAR